MTEPLRADQLFIFVEGLTLEASIGINPAERRHRQPVVIDVGLYVDVKPPLDSENITDTVSYDDVVDAARRIVAAGHIDLVETLAERIAAAALADARVVRVRVRVAKPTIIPEASAVGVTIERQREPA